mgnify:CR=1 FL=1
MRARWTLSGLIGLAISFLAAAAAQAHGEPIIVVEPTSAVAGDRITVTGSEMEPGEVFTLYVEGRGQSFSLGQATVTGEGEEGGFTISLTLPSDLEPGTYSVRAATETGESAVVDLSVTALASQAGSERAGEREPSAEPMLVDRSTPGGVAIGAGLIATVAAAAGLWLILRGSKPREA